MLQILKDKIPTKVKIEVTLEIDRDLWMESIESGTDPNVLLNKAASALHLITTKPSADIFRDHDSPIVTAIIYE